MKDIINAMMALAADEVGCGSGRSDGINISAEDAEKLYVLSSAHDMAHLVGDILIRKNFRCSDETRKKFEKAAIAAAFRYEKLFYEQSKIQSLLNDEGISYIALKGAVMRQYYPEPWMRTSCDIDILIHKEDMERTLGKLVERFWYRVGHRGTHDVCVFSPGNVELELHYSLIEENRVGTADKPLENIWQYAKPKDGGAEYVLSNEMFRYYHIAHMAKHIEYGGCGIRPFLDLKLLNDKQPYDDKKYYELLNMGGLVQFAEEAEALSEAWFGNGEYSDTARRLGQYVVGGGVYGTVDNHIAAQRSVKGGGKIKYAINRIWLPYDVLIFHYPSLKGRRALLPLYEVRRWLKLVFRGGAARSVKELKVNSGISDEKLRDISELLNDLGL